MSDDGKVVSLESKRPHLSGEARCLGCKHEWSAAVPMGSIWLECPKCSLKYGRLIHPVERGGKQWVCNCGNDLFHLKPEGMYCPCCGDWVTGWENG